MKQQTARRIISSGTDEANGVVWGVCGFNSKRRTCREVVSGVGKPQKRKRPNADEQPPTCHETGFWLLGDHGRKAVFCLGNRFDPLKCSCIITHNAGRGYSNQLSDKYASA